MNFDQHPMDQTPSPTQARSVSEGEHPFDVADRELPQAGCRPSALDELTGELRVGVEHAKNRPIPDGAIERVIERAASLGSPVVRSNRHATRRAVLGVAVATAACLILGLWLSRPANLWAQVVAAVQAKPWIHGISRGSKGESTDEFWISTTTGNMAFRADGATVFFDFQSFPNRLPLRAKHQNFVPRSRRPRRTCY